MHGLEALIHPNDICYSPTQARESTTRTIQPSPRTRSRPSRSRNRPIETDDRVRTPPVKPGTTRHPVGSASNERRTRDERTAKRTRRTTRAHGRQRGVSRLPTALTTGDDPPSGGWSKGGVSLRRPTSEADTPPQGEWSTPRQDGALGVQLRRNRNRTPPLGGATGFRDERKFSTGETQANS